MRQIYKVVAHFDYPLELASEVRTENYLIEAGSVGTAFKLGEMMARREHRNGGKRGYVPRIISLVEMGSIDVR